MLKIIRITRDSLTLEWFAPIAEGGAPVTKYNVYKKDITMDYWEEVGFTQTRTTKFTISNLRENRQYVFGVSAVNKKGEGDRIETGKPIMFKKAVGKYRRVDYWFQNGFEIFYVF